MGNFTRILAVAAVAGGFLTAPTVNAQQRDQTQPPEVGSGKPSTPSADVSDEKLDRAAAAIQRVASLKEDYRERMASATPTERERISNEAANALTKAVTDQGLSVEEYTKILQVAENDMTVRTKIMQRIRVPEK